MLKLKQVTREQIAEVAAYIAPLNAQREHYVAWLGMSEAQIEKELQELPYIPFEDCFLQAVEDGRVVGVIGYYGFPERGHVRPLGPYITHDDYTSVAQLLWNELLTLVPESCPLARVALDEQNAQGVAFYEAGLGFTEYNAEAMLKMERADYAPSTRQLPAGIVIEQYRPEHWEAFQALHFTSGYYTAEEIVNLTSQGNPLFILRSGDQFEGYGQVLQGATAFDIAFLQVSEASRGKGYGTLLIDAMLDWGFAQAHNTRAEICVRLTNYGARKLYERCGFEEELVIRALEKTI
ncbi:acetyltransferase (GNAT) family protein [Tumebacillus sp. BK434]|uniref:GNAT family N-acetyltransferase n=1 Tax=Tumebacillus sp. BK434 TaxID=2512169 RepID=UPI001049772C|nr:GNAT family N-acetyltransferase [Tumebacillus sp. BK434]TCP57582.1 acetyltransferase (GNAT) family protein [Tumebacillus sp. BK434]